MLQCAAVCCSVLQCTAVCCSVLQCVAVCCSVLQCVAVSVGAQDIPPHLLPLSPLAAQSYFAHCGMIMRETRVQGVEVRV